MTFGINFTAPNKLVAEARVRQASAPQTIKDFLLAAIDKFHDTDAIFVSAYGVLGTGGQFDLESNASIVVKRG